MAAKKIASLLFNLEKNDIIETVQWRSTTTRIFAEST